MSLAWPCGLAGQPANQPASQATKRPPQLDLKHTPMFPNACDRMSLAWTVRQAGQPANQPASQAAKQAPQLELKHALMFLTACPIGLQTLFLLRLAQGKADANDRLNETMGVVVGDPVPQVVYCAVWRDSVTRSRWKMNGCTHACSRLTPHAPRAFSEPT